MGTFTKKITISGNGTLEFLFSRIFTVDGIKFFVSVIDKESKSHLFYMERFHTEWRIVNALQVAAWLQELENDFSHAILGHLANQRRDGENIEAN